MSSSAEEPLPTKTQRALQVKCARCKAEPGQSCWRWIETTYNRKIKSDTWRPHRERYDRIAKEDLMATAKALKISGSALVRRRQMAVLARLDMAQAHDAYLEFNVRENELMREWLAAHGDIFQIKETP